MNFRRSDLSLPKWIQIVIVCAVLIFSVLQYLLNYRYTQQLNAEHVQQLNTMVSANLKTMMRFPLAVEDVAAVTVIAEEIMQNDSVWAIEIRNADDRIIERKERDDKGERVILDKKTVQIFDNRLPLQLDQTADIVEFEPPLLGTVYVYFTTDKQIEAINKSLQTNTLLFSGVILVLALIGARLFLNFSRSVNRVNAEMQKIIDGDYTVAIPRTHVREFNILASKLEDVSHTVQGQMNALMESQATARDKQREAEKSSEQQVKFMQIISHEIRSPVHVLVNMLDAMQDEVSKQQSPRARKMFEAMQESTAELQSAIAEMLDVEAFENGQVNLKITENAVNASILEVCERFRQKFKNKGLKFEFEDEPHPLEFSARFDKGKLERVIVNLLENAFRYTNTGIVSVSWRVNTTTDDDTLEVIVRDSGIGIAPENQARIFDRFYQVTSPHVRQQQGRGIGLAMVKELVTLMGGRITLNSELKKGTTFSFTIPVHVIETFSTMPPQGVGFDSDCRVLVIDDKEVNCHVLLNMLEKYDIEAEYTTDPHTGLNKALRKSYNVILVDYHMPNLDGATLTADIRKSQYNADTVILCITADQTVTNKAEVAAHFDGVIIKPIDAKKLAGEIENAMFSRRNNANIVYGHFHKD